MLLQILNRRLIIWARTVSNNRWAKIWTSSKDRSHSNENKSEISTHVPQTVFQISKNQAIFSFLSKRININCLLSLNNSSYHWRKKERILRLLATLRYRVLSEDSFKSRIFFVRLLLAVVLDRRSAWRRVPPLNHLSAPYTLTKHKGQWMPHVISMHHPFDPR